MRGVVDGFSLFGTNAPAIIETCVIVMLSGTFFDMGTATISAFSILNCATTLNGATWLSGLTDSGNVAAGALATIANNKFIDAGTILSGISVDDGQWQFALNDDIPDTKPDALITLSGNATETVITTPGVAVLVEGTWVEEDASQFTTDVDGRVIYIGLKNVPVPIDISFSLLTASGGSKQVTACVAINGTVEPKTVIQTTASASAAGAGITIWQIIAETDDFIELFVSNETDTVNIIAQATFRVN